MIRRTIETLAAGCAVYVLMSACSAASAPKNEQEAAAGTVSSGGQRWQGGVSGGVPGAAGDLGMAGLLDPVAGASAQVGGAPGMCDCPDPYVSPEPVIVEAVCLPQAGSATKFAVAEFPGKTESELQGMIALVKYDPEGTADFPASFPAGFGTQIGLVYVKDGSAAAQCGSSQFSAETVTFVLP